MFYDVEQDPLCYAGTTVLRNKLDLHVQQDLTDFEFTMFLSRASEPLPDGNLDYPHYQAIHHHLFQDVYDWAGQPRAIRTGKGSNWFCHPEHIQAEAERLFRWLAERDHLMGLDMQGFPSDAAYFLSELNAIHPFREGNGRAQLAFLKLLTLNAGRSFNDDVLEPQRTLSAMIESFRGNIEPLTALIADLIA